MREAWRQTKAGWWSLHWGSYQRWRTARRFHHCSECDRVIAPGRRYVESLAAPWHDVAGEVVRNGRIVRAWSRHRLCSDHPQWAPPESVAA